MMKIVRVPVIRVAKSEWLGATSDGCDDGRVWVRVRSVSATWEMWDGRRIAPLADANHPGILSVPRKLRGTQAAV